MNFHPQLLMTLRPGCSQVLADLDSKLKGLQTAVVSTADGLVVASHEQDSGAARRVAAMAAALSGLSQSVARELKSGMLQGTVIECDDGIVFCRTIVGRAMQFALLVQVSADENYGMALWAVKQGAASLQGQLDALPLPSAVAG